MPTPPKITIDLSGDVLAVGADGFFDLRRELARRREDRGSAGGPGVTVPVGSVVMQAVQDRQHEARGLAGAGLGRGEQIAAGEHERDGFRLDRGGDGVARVGDGAQQRFRQAQGRRIEFRCH